MKKITHTFEISQPAWELLFSLKSGRLVEYRDPEWPTLEDFKNCKIEVTPIDQNQIDIFLRRNSGGTYWLIPELLKHNLVQEEPNTWHPTYQISELGLEVLKNNL